MVDQYSFMRRSRALKVVKRGTPWWIGSAIVIVILVLGLSAFSSRTRASLAVFYPDNCLGGWKNPTLAQGRPSTQGVFDESNSASVDDEVADIFCGAWKGDIPANSFPKEIYLKLSWGVEGSTLTANAISAISSISSATSTINVTPENFASSSQAIIDISSSTPSQLNIVFSEASSSVSEPSVPQSSASTTFTPSASVSAPVPAAVPAPTSDPIPTPPPAPTPDASPASADPAPTSPTSFNFSLISVAHADEVTTSTASTIATATTTTSTAASSSAATSTDDSSSGGFLEVSYTVNGSTWKTLARVSPDLFSRTFKLDSSDIASWQNLAHLQVRVSRLSTINKEPKVYLDAMSLEVSYDAGPSITKSAPKLGESILAEADMIHAVSALPESYLGIYRVDNPDTYPEPSYVFGSQVGAGGELQLAANTLPLGHFIFVNTSDVGACNSFSLEGCRADPRYIGEVSFAVVSDSEKQKLIEANLAATAAAATSTTTTASSTAITTSPAQ